MTSLDNILLVARTSCDEPGQYPTGGKDEPGQYPTGGKDIL